jgi:hypothetical protein
MLCRCAQRGTLRKVKNFLSIFTLIFQTLVSPPVALRLMRMPGSLCARIACQGLCVLTIAHSFTR